jgi:hypothetical protein
MPFGPAGFEKARRHQVRLDGNDMRTYRSCGISVLPLCDNTHRALA